ncbi:MAG: sigma-70 family RNA polymerase sigma factor [Actinobacteria bacterium]|nr:sigma-70 family RNA polymerase sigma factor [Actinomycetota bacterium]
MTGGPEPTYTAIHDAAQWVAVRGDATDTYQRLYEPLCRMAFLLVDTREQAEEVVQEAFARALPRWERLTNPDAYVRASVLNGCRRVHRRRALARRRPVSHDGLETAAVTDHVIDALRRLPSPQREVVVLRFYLQSTDAEIAATLNIPIGTVKSSLSRAKTRLKEDLQ